MSTPTTVVGNVMRSTITFAPASGTVVDANVSCKLNKAGRAETDVTADIVDDGGEVFHVDYEVAENDPPGLYTFRWESSSPRIVLEDSSTQFTVTASRFATP